MRTAIEIDVFAAASADQSNLERAGWAPLGARGVRRRRVSVATMRAGDGAAR